jgi:nucleotide-binding universal stress UspA family protein
MFTRIVLAYNHTPRAQRALKAAVQMAREGDAELIAVAVERSLVLSGESITEVRAVHAARERACTGWLSFALAYAGEGPGASAGWPGRTTTQMCGPCCGGRLQSAHGAALVCAWPA